MDADCDGSDGEEKCLMMHGAGHDVDGGGGNDNDDDDDNDDAVVMITGQEQ